MNIVKMSVITLLPFILIHFYFFLILHLCDKLNVRVLVDLYSQQQRAELIGQIVAQGKIYLHCGQGRDCRAFSPSSQ